LKRSSHTTKHRCSCCVIRRYEWKFTKF